VKIVGRPEKTLRGEFTGLQNPPLYRTVKDARHSHAPMSHRSCARAHKKREGKIMPKMQTMQEMLAFVRDSLQDRRPEIVAHYSGVDVASVQSIRNGSCDDFLLCDLQAIMRFLQNDYADMAAHDAVTSSPYGRSGETA